MENYLILCRSLTYAQRTVHALSRARVTCRMIRTPHEITTAGCGYSVKLQKRYLTRALVALRIEGLSPKQLYIQQEGGRFVEVKI